ncbi:DUF1302 domain-containing protein [Pseudomonas saliphila]|uniref:DUF1302 domain-containing protein n=1 Tax=Pseudomonas saliphila TaxID=2586906 RepID=UPI001238AF3E|nr:DUF1302 domain-containing protein [Pseudomonas saliphila]
MTKKMHAWTLSALPLAISLASLSGAAHAVNFNIGPVDAQFDSQLSIGASVSTTDADKRFIHFDTAVDGVPQGGQAVARTTDDGRLNYESGDVFSKIFKGSHDLELRYGDSGAFFRGNYWYDFETKDGSQRFYDISDSGRHPLQQGSGVQLLDAFVYHNYSIGNNPGNVRLGRQVVSWGESTFIQNSINSINPIDVSAFRRPGAEIKEGLLPVEMLYLSQGLTDNLSMEAFYQLKWSPTVVDNCGTFFGTDTAGRGCTDRLVVAGPDRPQGDPTLQAGALSGLGVTDYIVRLKDDEASDSGQYGLAFRWYLPAMNDTELGFYAMNYHSRAPVYSNIAGRALGPNALVGAGAIPAAALAAPGVISPVEGYQGDLGPAGYFFEFPEDIRLYGLSFQTSLGGTSVGGEISYRPNMPMQISTGDMSRAALLTAVVPLAGGIAVPNSDNTHRGLAGNVDAGDYIQGYDRKEYFQAQITAVHFIDRILGASRLSLVGEVGVAHIGGISESPGTTKYGRDSLFGQSPFADGSCSSNDGSSPKGASWCETDGFYTSTSWGYRIRSSLEYSNVFAGVNLSPSLAWSHDVEGYGPSFQEDAKSISVGLNADYANKYNASLSYTNFFDGKYNTMVDRDFAALSVGVSF